MVEIPNRSKLKMMCGQLVSNNLGIVQLDLKIPGVAGQEHRVLAGGSGWFDVPLAGDMFDGVDVVDIDGIVTAAMVAGGMTQEQADAQALVMYPNYPTLDSFAEDSVTSPAHKGWFMPTTNPLVVESIGGEEQVPSGFYLRFNASKSSAVVDTFRVNVYWGK